MFKEALIPSVLFGDTSTWYLLNNTLPKHVAPLLCVRVDRQMVVDVAFINAKRTRVKEPFDCRRFGRFFFHHVYMILTMLLLDDDVCIIAVEPRRGL